jgi:hypothetical protein
MLADVESSKLQLQVARKLDGGADRVPSVEEVHSTKQGEGEGVLGELGEHSNLFVLESPLWTSHKVPSIERQDWKFGITGRC